MKDKKCKIVIEFQAIEDDILKFAAKRLDIAVSHITGMADVTATIKIPDKFNPYAKS